MRAAGGSPDIVVSAEDHAALGVAGRADVPQLGLAAGALEAAAVPVAVHGVEQEAVGESGAGQGRLGPGGARSARSPAPAAALPARSSPGCVRLVGRERSVRGAGKKKVAELVCQCRVPGPGRQGAGGCPQSGFFSSETRKHPQKALRAEDAAPGTDR